MRKLGIFPRTKEQKPYKPNPYEQMDLPGQRIQIDVKIVPLKYLANPEKRLFQYTTIDEYPPSAVSGHLLIRRFPQKDGRWFKRRCVTH